MDVAALGVMVPIVLIIGTFIMIIYLRKYENDERMAMIDKGVDPQFFNLRKLRNNSFPLRASLLLIGAGIGLMFGYYLDETFDMEEVAYFSMLFIFGGIGLGASYLVEERKFKAEKENDKRS